MVVATAQTVKMKTEMLEVADKMRVVTTERPTLSTSHLLEEPDKLMVVTTLAFIFPANTGWKNPTN